LENKPFFLFAYLFGWLVDFEAASHYINQAGLKLTTLQPQPSLCWNQKHAQPQLFLMIWFASIAKNLWENNGY
jgi:hypothetical protein